MNSVLQDYAKASVYKYISFKKMRDQVFGIYAYYNAKILTLTTLLDLETLRQTISVTSLHAKNQQFIRNMLAITFSLYLNLSFVLQKCKI